VSRNVVLLILDTARKDYFEEYAPRLQSMSDVSFSNCRAASSCSVPSHASILTGDLPYQHGLHSESVDYTSIDDDDTFFAAVPDHEALGVSANTFAGSSFGFDSHFDFFRDVSWTRRFPDGLDVREYQNEVDGSGIGFYLGYLRACLGHDAPIKSLMNGGLAQLDLLSAKSPFPKLFDDGSSSVLKQTDKLIGTEQEPFVLFLNLMDIHTPHHHVRSYDKSIHGVSSSWTTIDQIDLWDVNLNPDERDETAVENFRKLYAAAIDYLDRRVASFVTDLLESTDRETTVVITADHGENLGFDAEDRLMGHSNGLSEALLHVPLEIINPPQGYGAVESAYFSQLQLGELLAGLAAGETPAVFTETPVAERITTSGVPDRADDKSFWRRTIRCIYEDGRKIVWDSLGRTMTYRLDPDRPCWQESVAEGEYIPDYDRTHFDLNIETTHERLVDGSSSLEDVDAATKARLEELGYL